MVIDIDLEPCPFCGGKAIGEYTQNNGDRYYYVRCSGIDHCEIKPYTFNYLEGNEFKAITAWNKRR